MLLRDVLLVILAVMLLIMLSTALLKRWKRSSNGDEATLAAGIIMPLLLVSLFVRSEEFGADTVTYVQLVGDFCRGQLSDDLSLGYQLSILVINVGMLGACEEAWLPAAWAIVISGLLLCLPVPWPFRLRYVTLLLFSLIGIELTTNALRQGLSVAVCVLSIAFWHQHRLLAFLLAVTAVVLHSSTALVLLALALSALPWVWFLLGLLMAIGAVMFFIESGLEPPLVQPMLYEIQKYMAHDGDEVWIRVLAFSSVVGALLATLLSTDHACRKKLLGNQAYSIALRIGLCCVPFLVLPYFGYRIIYGIYPLTLYFTLLIGPPEGVRVTRQFALLLCFNALLLLAWSQGSTYMRDVPFF